MKVDDFYTILQTTDEVKDLSPVEKISEQYPYFFISQLLYISLLYKTNDNEFNNALKKFSHNIPNRKYFFQRLKKLNKKVSSPFKETSTIENIPQQITMSLPSSEINAQEPLSIQDVSKELNKSISESIIQTEILQITPHIQTKANKLIESTNAKTEEKQKKSSSISTSENKAHNNEIIQENHHTESATSTLYSVALSDALKRYTQQTQRIPQEYKSEDKKEKIKKQQQIIDRIISNPPKPPKSPQKFFSPENKAKESLIETEDLVTETLAQIYAAQGNIHKAIRAYEILCLKFPQKNTYFAAKIEELKNQLKNKNQ